MENSRLLAAYLLSHYITKAAAPQGKPPVCGPNTPGPTIPRGPPPEKGRENGGFGGGRDVVRLPPLGWADGRPAVSPLPRQSRGARMHFLGRSCPGQCKISSWWSRHRRSGNISSPT